MVRNHQTSETLASPLPPPTPEHSETDPAWRRTLYVMWLAQLVAIMGFSFVMPFIPFYIRELGITEERWVALWAGILVSGAGLTMTFAAPLWGKLADKYGRKPMVLRSMFAGAAVVGLMGAVANVHQLLLLRLLQGALTGTVAASMALVSSTTPKAHLGYSLGLMQTAIFTGAAIGPWLGGISADHLGYRLSFAITGGLLLLSGLLVLLGARESFCPPDPKTAKAQGGIRRAAAIPGFPTVLAVFFLVNLAGTVVFPIFPLFVEKLMVSPARAASTTGLILAVSGLAAGLAAAIIGRLSDQVGQKKILVVCTLFSGLFCLPQAIAQSVGQLFGLRAAFGLAAGGTGPTINALVGKMMPRSSYGRAYGLTSSVSCLGGALGPLLGGIMASSLGLRMPFVITGSLLVLISAVVAWRVRESSEIGARKPG